MLSVLLLIYGLTIVQLALFQREMRFRALAIRETAAVLVGGVLGLVLALRGAGVWALVAQQLGFAATQLVLLWGMSTWRPRFRFSSAHARDLLGFSSGVFLSNLGGFLNRRADALLMGIFFGPVAVGLYRLADRFSDNVLELTMRPVGHVALPFFSRLQNDRPALKNAVASSIRTTLILTVPAMAVMAACSDFLMAVMGSEWEPAADVLKLLALVGIGKAIVFFTGPLLFAVARPHLRAVMLWALAALSAGTVLLVGWLLTDEGSREQALGMAASRAAFFLAIVIPVNLAVVCWITGLRPRSFLPWLPSPLLSAAARDRRRRPARSLGAPGRAARLCRAPDRRHSLPPRRRGRPLRTRAACAPAGRAGPPQAHAPPGRHGHGVKRPPTEWSREKQ